MKKLLGIVVLGLLISVNSFAKTKKGSGPLKFNEKTIVMFHHYVTQKLNKDIMDNYNLPGLTMAWTRSPFYANFFCINGYVDANNFRPFIFQWEAEGVNRSPLIDQTYYCDFYFAKKNRIVWKGAKKKISRKVTIEELKDILRDLGFYN